MTDIPEDIPADVWKAAGLLAMQYVEWLTPTPTDADAEHVLSVTIARALLAAEKRGEERERERGARYSIASTRLFARKW